MYFSLHLVLDILYGDRNMKMCQRYFYPLSNYDWCSPLVIHALLSEFGPVNIPEEHPYHVQ